MAYPTIASYNTGHNDSSSVPQTILFPTDSAIGDTIVLVIGTYGSSAPTSPTWLPAIKQVSFSTRYLSVFVGQIKTTPGTSFTINSPNGGGSSWVCMRFSSVLLAAYADASQTGSSTTPDAPSLSSPFAGSSEIMWLSAAGVVATTTVTGYPANFPDNNYNASTAYATAACVGMATLSNTSSSADASAFGLSASASWAAFTVALKISDVTNKELASIVNTAPAATVFRNGFYIERKKGADGAWVVVGFSATASFTDDGADFSPGDTYYYRIRYFNNFGNWSEYSAAKPHTFKIDGTEHTLSLHA